MIRLKGTEYLTVAEYTKKIGISEMLVRRYCRNGRLKAIKVSNRWFIPANEYPTDYEPRTKDGTYVGLADLKRGDIESFLHKRGITL
jgi:hypothetical protein